MVRDRTSPTKISHLCWSNVLYSFWALWWWVYLQGCLRTPFYHPINAGFMRGKRLGGFKRHFIQSKVFPVSKWSDLMVYSCCQSCVHFSAIGGECFLRRGFMRIFYQIQKKTFGKFLLQSKHAFGAFWEQGALMAQLVFAPSFSRNCLLYGRWWTNSMTSSLLSTLLLY